MNRYYAMNRPDTVPKPFDNWESWYPSRPVQLPDGERYIFGFADYAEPLTHQRTWEYDMLPADPLEQTRYLLWLNADRNDQHLAWLIEDYESISDYDLSQEGGRVAELILRLRALSHAAQP